MILLLFIIIPFVVGSLVYDAVKDENSPKLAVAAAVTFTLLILYIAVAFGGVYSDRIVASIAVFTLLIANTRDMLRLKRMAKPIWGHLLMAFTILLTFPIIFFNLYQDLSYFLIIWFILFVIATIIVSKERKVLPHRKNTTKKKDKSKKSKKK